MIETVSGQTMRTTVNWKAKLAILAGGVQVAVTFSIAGPLLGRMTLELAETQAEAYLVKMTVGVMGVAMVLGAPLGGFLADRIGRLPVLVLAGLLFALAGIAPVFLDDIRVILAARFVVGLAAAASGTMAAALVGDCFSEAERPRWMGILIATAMGAGLMTTPIAGFLGDFSWRLPFWLHGVGLALAALAWFGLRDLIPPAGRKAVKLRGQQATGQAGHRQGRGRLPSSLLFLAFLIGLLSFTPAIYLPFRLLALGAKDPSQVGMALTASAVASLAVASLFGLVRRRLSSPAIFCISFFAMALGTAMLAVSPSFSLVLAGMFLIGLGMAWLSPNLLSLALTVADEANRGRTIGFVKSAQSIAAAVGVTALEPLANIVGVQGVLLLTAALACALFGVMAARAFAVSGR